MGVSVLQELCTAVLGAGEDVLGDLVRGSYYQMHACRMLLKRK